MLERRPEQHNRYIEEVKQNASNCAPKGINVAPADAFAEENTMMVILFNANIAVVAMISVTLGLDLA